MEWQAIAAISIGNSRGSQLDPSWEFRGDPPPPAEFQNDQRFVKRITLATR